MRGIQDFFINHKGFLVELQGLVVAPHPQIRHSDIVVGNRQQRMRGIQDFFIDRQGFLLVFQGFFVATHIRIRTSDIVVESR